MILPSKLLLAVLIKILFLMQEVLYSEMDLGEYDNDFMEHDGGNGECSKGSMEMVTLAGIAGPLEVNPGRASDDDDDADLNFLDDDISE